jgi:hypothetical protein
MRPYSRIVGAISRTGKEIQMNATQNPNITSRERTVEGSFGAVYHYAFQYIDSYVRAGDILYWNRRAWVFRCLNGQDEANLFNPTTGEDVTVSMEEVGVSGYSTRDGYTV